jgi:hypothetical protein
VNDQMTKTATGTPKEERRFPPSVPQTQKHKYDSAESVRCVFQVAVNEGRRSVRKDQAAKDSTLSYRLQKRSALKEELAVTWARAECGGQTTFSPARTPRTSPVSDQRAQRIRVRRRHYLSDKGKDGVQVRWWPGSTFAPGESLGLEQLSRLGRRDTADHVRVRMYL